MTTSTEPDAFVRTYADRPYRFPTMVRHNGVVLAFAMDEHRRIYYTILDFSPAGSTSAKDADHWSPNPQLLTFANEIASVGFGVADQAQLPMVRAGTVTAVPAGQTVRADELDPFLSTTARFSAAAPFQVVSDGRYIYLFRQAITEPDASAVTTAELALLDPHATDEARATAADLIADRTNMAYATDAAGQPVLDEHGRQVPLVAGTLLVDRFVLVGTQLAPKREVRYQRSRSRTRPAGRTDSLGAADLNKVPFVEPTQNLRFVPAITSGRFAAVLVPTQVAEVFRWQLFTHDAAGDVIWCYSIERTDDGLFNTRGTQPLTCTDHPDLYALAPGTCPRPSVDDPSAVCGKVLVARLPEGTSSRTALVFPADGSGVVTLDGAGATGTEFTVEAWLAPDAAATGERALVTCAGDVKTAGPSIWLRDAQSLRIGFGDGTAFHDVTTPALLSPSTWNHLAVTYAAGLLQVYINGTVRFASSDFANQVPSPTPIAALGAPSGGYGGLVDDVRVWTVALSTQDVETGRHATLTGLEAGLVGYWRLDEGQGTATWDAATYAKGLLDGPAWVTSDAPIATAAGLSRFPLRMQDRSVSGGLAATLYFQQENAVSGYAGSPPAPLKQAARVMLAAVTCPTGADTSSMVALDFGVAVDGTLAQAPGEVTLTELDVPGGGPGTGADVLSKLFGARADVADLTQSLAEHESALSAATQAADAITAVLAGQVPGPVPAQYGDVSAAIASYRGISNHLAALRQSFGQVERALLEQLISLAETSLATAQAVLTQQQSTLSGTIATLTPQVADEQTRLAAAQATLDQLKHLLNGDTVLPMPLLGIDATGLTTSGAVLGFAPASGVPVLVDGALGRVTLYFHDDAGQFLLAYFDAFTGRATLHLGAETGEVAFLARSAIAEMDEVTLTVSVGSADATCTLVATLPGDAGVTETWTDLPRDIALLAPILNGTTQATFLATVAATAKKTSTLNLTAPLNVPVPAGALVTVGATVLTTTAAAARGDMSVKVHSQQLNIADGTPLNRIAYDYASATSTRAGADLSKGSVLVGVDARGASGMIQLGTAALLGITPSCQWFAAPPGTTIDFNGKTTRAGVLANTAIRLDGRSGVTLADHAELDITGAVTIEAWVRPAAMPQDFGNIVVRGFTMQPNGEVYLRITNGQYQIGSWDGTDHLAASPVPPGDIGTWVHLAGVYDGAAWHLYRNGLLLSSTVDAVGAVEVAAGWAIGTTSDGDDRFFTGDIDDIRIWNRPLGPQEITDGISRRLTGSEAGLSAYLYMDGGVLVDHDVSPAATRSVGHPAQAPSPPPLGRLGGFDVTGDVSMETWVNPSDTGDCRLLVHHSSAAAYGLALRRRNTALHFDGVQGHLVSLPSVPALAITGQITIEAWVRPAAIDSLRDVVACGPATPAAEIYLRLSGGSYQIGRWSGTGSEVTASFPIPSDDLNTWVHLAGVYDGTAWHLYRNGQLEASAPDTAGAIPVSAGWTIGGSHNSDRLFVGDIDEVRLWSIGRTAADLKDTMDSTLTGTEQSLVGVWRYDGKVMRDGTPGRHDGAPIGLSTANPGAHPVYSVIATVGNQGVESVPWIPADEWTHIAATFEQFYGVQFAVGGYLDAGDSASLNLSRELTIEAGVQLDDMSAPHGILTRGVLDDGTDDDVPYALWVSQDGSLVFGFEDKSHGVHQFTSDPGVLRAHSFRRIAVTRRHNVEVDTSNAGQKGGSAVVSSWDDITFYADGAQVGAVQRYNGPDVGSSLGSTLIGRAFGPGSVTMGLRGALSEVRLWSAAREASVVSTAITGKEVGLVSWWRMQDGQGNIASDSKGSRDAMLHGQVSWVHTPDGRGSALVTYIDGEPVATTSLDPTSLTPADQQFTVGALGNSTPSHFFAGQLEELRIWRVTRTAEEIQDNLFGRLTGEAADLVAYYPFDAGAMLDDSGLRGNDLIVTGGGWILSTAPIGEDTPLARNAVLGLRTRFNGVINSSPVAAEYAELQLDASGTTAGVLKRCYAYVDVAGAWHLVTGFKVGDLTTQWVGQAQFDPQLIGYLEGAPPVPSENLTVQDSYTGTASVSLTDATTTTYTYASTRDSGFNATFELSGGEGADVQTFAGLIEIEAPLGVGVGEVELTSAVDTGVSFTGKANFETSLSWLNDTTTSQGTTRTKVSALQLTGNKETTPAHQEIGARYVPNNIGFALVQSQTADVFALRLAHTGTLVAYEMMPNPDIPKDYNIITFPIDPHYTKQGVLDGKVGGFNDSDYPNAGSPSSDVSYFKPIEAYGLKAQIERQEQELSTLYAQHSVDPNQLSGGQLPDMVAPVKRDLVNNYVWTADGGQYAESTSALDTYDESVGGSYHFQGLAGGTVTADVSIFGAAVTFELSAMFGGHLDLSVTKTLDSEHSFEVDVVADGESDITTVDGTGKHVKAPGKVDAYRWLTFYLAPRSDNYDAFFNQVVDPIWLAQSDDPAAAALRQAKQDGKRPAAWRVLHRVTYVSRVLAPVGSTAPLDEALAALDIASNYELIRTLEPFVRGHTGQYHDFLAAVRNTVNQYLPDLLPHIDDILNFAVLYYEVRDAPQLAGAQAGL